MTAATYISAREAAAVSAKFGGAHRRYDYQLRGLVVCGRCGYTMIGRPWGKAHGYYCHRCPKGGRGFVNEAQLIGVLWGDILDCLAHPDATLRAIARSASEVGSTEQRADAELLELAQKLRELDAQEAQLLELRLSKTISGPVLERKAKAIGEERERLNFRMKAVREERASAARAIEESAAVRRLLDQLGRLAQEAGEDSTRRIEIIRTATRGITFHASSHRVHIRYAFGTPARADSSLVAAEQSAAS